MERLVGDAHRRRQFKNALAVEILECAFPYACQLGEVEVRPIRFLGIGLAAVLVEGVPIRRGHVRQVEYHALVDVCKPEPRPDAGNRRRGQHNLFRLDSLERLRPAVGLVRRIDNHARRLPENIGAERPVAVPRDVVFCPGRAGGIADGHVQVLVEIGIVPGPLIEHVGIPKTDPDRRRAERTPQHPLAVRDAGEAVGGRAGIARLAGGVVPPGWRRVLHHREGTGARSRRTLVRPVREERRPAVGRHLERLYHGVGRRVGRLRHRQQFGVRERLRPGGGCRRLVEVVDRDVARREQYVEARTEVVRMAHLHRLHRRVQVRRVVHERRYGLRRDVHAHHLPLRGGERVFHAVHGVHGHGVHRGEARGDRVRLGVGGAGERAFHEQALAPRVRGV